jgi:ABC-type thiamine transport system ATPase subunit
LRPIRTHAHTLLLLIRASSCRLLSLIAAFVQPKKGQTVLKTRGTVTAV